ncbi:MAG: hypothetical protein R3C18_10540 [Planctomycetaceae bacterium]
MQLSQIVRKTLRRLALSAVIGGGLASPLLYHGLSYGQQPPRQLTLPTQAITKLEPIQESTPGAAVTPVQYEEPVEKVGFFQKLFRGTRRAQIPQGPPQDPGMNYPKKSDFPATQQQARTASASQGNQSLELVPPGWNPNAPSGPLTAPAVTSQDILMPPGGLGPSGGSQFVPPSADVLVPPAGSDLKAYLAETPKASPSSAGLLVPPPADGGDERSNILPPISPAPQLPAISPAPQVAASPQFEPPSIQPGVAATQQPKLQAPSLDLPPAAPTTPATPKDWTGTRPSGDDALTLTPAPVDKPAAIVEAPPAVAQTTAPAPSAEVMQQEIADAAPEPDMSKPYTGLALEEDMFQPPIPVSGTTPAPQEPAPVVDAATQVATEPAVVANTNPLPPPTPPMEPEQVPELPSIGESTVTIEANGVGTAEIPATTDTAAPALQTPPPLVLAPGLPAVPQATQPQQAPAPSQSIVQAPTSHQAAAPKDEREEKMALIRSRTGMSGLKGFCAVALRDDRELLDTNEEFSALFNGKLYSFSSEENLERFLEEPMRYAPASRGNDVIHLALTGEEVEGSLDHAVWYQGRLYLFTSVETLETFTAAPSSHAVYE